jgi:transcriptional regulator with XRE-family HTH domain
MNPDLAVTLRAKKLGILIRDARLSSGKTMKECGAAIGVSGSTISSYEKGISSPSLPELEMLAYYLKIPINRFWQDTVYSDDDESIDPHDVEHALVIRHRQVGDILTEARNRLEITYEEITKKSGVTYGRMKRFENGESPIPLPELELLCNVLKITLQDLFETESQAGKWISAQSGVAKFLELPTDIQTFVTNPTNIPYLEIAKKLSNLSADQLRSIAESLLDITI